MKNNQVHASLLKFTHNALRFIEISEEEGRGGVMNGVSHGADKGKRA